MTIKIKALAALFAASALVTACGDQDGPAEEAGAELDQAIEDVGQQIEEAKEDLQEEMDQE